MTAVAEPDVGYRQDMAVWPAVEAMAACVCSELDAMGGPELCFCGIFPGLQPADQMGDGEQGQAWVRVVAVYPSTTFPTQETRVRGSCVAGLAAELELGVLRCAPTATDNGMVPPSMEAQWEAARLQMADMAALRRAVQCCYQESDLAVIGRYTPVGPAGGFVGGMWQVFVSEAATPTPVVRGLMRRG